MSEPRRIAGRLAQGAVLAVLLAGWTGCESLQSEREPEHKAAEAAAEALRETLPDYAPPTEIAPAAEDGLPP